MTNSELNERSTIIKLVRDSNQNQFDSVSRRDTKNTPRSTSSLKRDRSKNSDLIAVEKPDEPVNADKDMMHQLKKLKEKNEEKIKSART